MIIAGISGDPKNVQTLESLREHKYRLSHMLKERKMKAFPRAFVCENLADCLSYNVQSAGLGLLHPNAVFLELPKVKSIDHLDDVVDFANIINIT